MKSAVISSFLVVSCQFLLENLEKFEKLENLENLVNSQLN